MHCVVEYEGEGERKVLEFGCQKPHIIRNFCLYLRELLQAKGIQVAGV